MQIWVAAAWVPYVIGACMQLCQPPIWAAGDQAALNLVLDQAVDLVNNLGIATLGTRRGPRPITNGGTLSAFIQCRAGGPFVLND